MAKEQKREKVLSWLREHPELLEKLDLMRQMEEDGLDSDFDRIELEMLGPEKGSNVEDRITH